MEERRKEPRSVISFPVACDFLPRRSYFYTVCKDLSYGGIRIITNNFIPRGHLLKINLNLIDKIIDVKAKVMWCNKERFADRYHAGLRFIEVEDTDKTYLKGFVTTTYKKHY